MTLFVWRVGDVIMLAIVAIVLMVFAFAWVADRASAWKRRRNRRRS